MSNNDSVSDSVRQLAEQAGLGKAFRLAPEIVAACVERGQHPLSKPPAALTPLTAPAPMFDPAAHERKK